MRTILLCLSIQLAPLGLFAENHIAQTTAQNTSFTGKITKDRVRMRLQPNLDAYIYKELKKGDLVLVTGQVDDFYACVPPKEVQAYIFRTYVLDGQVEGSNVNVRLEPEITSPVIAQLNSGYKIKGEIASQNNKWLKIAVPEDVRFYVAKEFITQVGDAELYSKHLQQQAQMQQTLTTVTESVDKELQKPFAQISLGKYTEQLHEIVASSSEFPQEAEKARELLTRMQKEYLAKGIASGKTEETIAPIAKEKEKETKVFIEVIEPKQETAHAPENSSWNDREYYIIQDAISNGQVSNMDEFYSNEARVATALSGIIKPYNSFIKNRPGDFILINPKTNLPIAYLYSTKVDLSKFIGKEVSMQASSRPNNNFAFAAYFVLSVTAN